MKENNLDAAERKSVWKMNYQMKNELGAKAKKAQLVNDGLMSKIREICVTNVTEQRIEHTKALIDKIDAFDQKSHTIEKRLYEIKSHTAQMEEEIPFMDEQIAFLKEELKMMNETEITAEEVCSLVEPKTELAQGILKYQSKYLSHQDTITNGMYSINEIDDVGDHLLFVRNVAKKQFAALHKKNKLVEYQSK